MKYLYLLLFVSVAAAGCLGHCQSKEKCIVEGEIFPTFYGFAHDEIDTIITRRYRTGSNFTDFVDSTQTDSLSQLKGIQTRYYATDTPSMYKLVDSNNSEIFYTPKFYSVFLDEGFEYEVEVPATGSKYRLGNIVLNGEVSKTLKYECNSDGADRRCFRKLVSYTFQSEKISAGANGYVERNIKMHK